jgi:hypothetical protein
MVRIQYFSFGLRGEMTGWSIVERWCGGNEFVLPQWDGSVIRCGSVAILIGGEAVSERRKNGDDASWADANLTGRKIKKSMRSIQLLQMDGEYLKQQWVNLFF